MDRNLGSERDNQKTTGRLRTAVGIIHSTTPKKEKTKEKKKKKIKKGESYYPGERKQIFLIPLLGISNRQKEPKSKE